MSLDPFMKRHKFDFYEDKLLYPYIIDSKELASGTIGAIVTGVITGTPIAALLGFVGGETATILTRAGFKYGAKVSSPLYKYIRFNPQDFVLFSGYKKNKDKELVTQDFRRTEVRQYDLNDKLSSELLARAFYGEVKEHPVYSEEELIMRQDEFKTKFLTKDVLAVGGPIPLDPLYKPIKSKSLPCNYELVNPMKFPLDKTGGEERYCYEIYRRGQSEPLIPRWNELNWGIITCLEKTVLFPGEKGRGLFFNVSGCNWYGTRGAALFISKKENLRKLKEAVERKIGQAKNWQAIVKVPIESREGIVQDQDQVQLVENEIYKVK